MSHPISLNIFAAVVFAAALCNECERQCPEGRTGGAEITFNICGDKVSMWFENDEFIDQAIAIKEGAPAMIPVMTLVEGSDCDSRWSWHVDPNEASWAEYTMELCDGCPDFVEEDLDYWLNTVGSYCPWSAGVVSVCDNR